MINFFGVNFQSQPDQFKFMIGDKKLIRIIISHIQKNGSQIKTKTKANENLMSEDAARTYYFLDKLKATADQNATRERGGYRFDDQVKKFALYLRIIAGPLAYKTLQNNLKCALPSLPSTNRYIQSSNCKILEGVPRIDELHIYLSSRNLPLVVAVSEDATRIVGRVQYDAKTNQLIGFAVPINKLNGMPIPFTFPARSAEEILSHFANENSPSQYLNVMMAQPLADVPPFCLMMYGSNNTHTTREVIKRWNFIKTELNRKNIEVVSFSTDSEPRYNATMRYCSNLGRNLNIMLAPPFYVQDIIHIATKLRNFLLNRRIIPFGNRFINLQHLFILLAKFRKDQHQLTVTVLNPKDRQNFASVQRMYDSKVINLLKSAVDGSEATVLFLEMIRDIIESYMDRDLSPLDRIRKIYTPLFILRIWRFFVLKSKNLKLKDHFLTQNCYSCIELNAISLVQIMLHLKNTNRESLFLPHLISSQPCESTFRLYRSLTTTYSTVTNSTVKEALSRISKIQLQNEIMHLTSPKFTYPKLSKQNETINTQPLPTEAEINDVISQCKQQAVDIAIKFNITANMKQATQCHIKPLTLKKEVQPKMIPARPNTKTLTVSDFRNIALRNYAGKKSAEITETSPYLEFNFDTKRIVVMKTSFCWLLRSEVKKVSNDRLLKFRTNIDSNKQRSTQRKIGFTCRRVVKY